MTTPTKPKPPTSKKRPHLKQEFTPTALQLAFREGLSEALNERRYSMMRLSKEARTSYGILTGFMALRQAMSLDMLQRYLDVLKMDVPTFLALCAHPPRAQRHVAAPPAQDAAQEFAARLIELAESMQQQARRDPTPTLPARFHRTLR